MTINIDTFRYPAWDFSHSFSYFEKVYPNVWISLFVIHCMRTAACSDPTDLLINIVVTKQAVNLHQSAGGNPKSTQVPHDNFTYSENKTSRHHLF